MQNGRNSLVSQGVDVTIAMAARYLFKVEYAENRFCSFFVNLLNVNDYSFIKLTNDIKEHVRALQVITPNTIRIRFRDDDGDYVNLPYGDHDLFVEMLKSGKVQNDREYTKIHLKVSELDSPIGMATHLFIKEQLKCGAPEIKPPQTFEPAVVDDDNDDKDLRIPVSKTQKKVLEKIPCQKTNRSLDATFLTAADDDVITTKPDGLSPLQRYISKLEDNVANQKRKVSLLKNSLYTVDEKIKQVKSITQIGSGQMCGNCHLRLGHTARNCSLDKCTDVFSCGFEKYHPNQINRSKLNQEIKKEETSLQKMETELGSRQSAMRSLENAPARKIEQRLLTENRPDYVVGGLKNWSLLRKHVHLIEGYCKRNFHGKIPPKESLIDILRLAEEGSSDDEEETLRHAKRRRTHENPAKSVLENYGVVFPGDCASSSSRSGGTHTTTCKVSNDGVRRYEPTTVEEEEAQLQLALQASSFDVGLQKGQPGQSNKEQSPRELIPNLSENDAANALMSLSNPTIAQ